MHLLAETITVPDLGGNCAELPNKLDFQQIRHGVKADQEFALAMPLDALNKEEPLRQQRDDLVNIYAGWKGDKQLDLFGLILN